MSEYREKFGPSQSFESNNQASAGVESRAIGREIQSLHYGFFIQSTYFSTGEWYIRIIKL